MIVISRGLARSVRALARKCVSGRPRGPAPPVVLEQRGGILTAWVKTDDAALVYTAPTDSADTVLVVPIAVLEAVEGAGDEPVELSVGPKLRGTTRWIDRGGPQSHPFEALLPGKQHRRPDLPDDGHPVPATFLAALHECGRSTARDAGRFALTRVQVRGQTGQVIGTDGRTALLWNGFQLPFTTDLLVPAVPVFGARELTGESEVKVSRTATHLVVAAGSWRVLLPVDPTGRYPDVAGVIPKAPPTVAGIDDHDAAALQDRLPGLPGADTDGQPITLDLDGGVVVRVRDETTGTVESVRLDRSPSAGPPARVVIDRRILARALALGCITVRVTPDKPVVFEGKDKTLIAVALDPALAVESTPNDDADATVPDTPRRRIPVKHETNGRVPNGRADPPATDALDPLIAAEELRTTLADAVTKVGRLVAALKSRRKEQKALTQVWSSLKALNLGPEGQP